MKRLFLSFSLGILAMFLLAACGGAVPAPQVVTLRAKEFGYEPAALTVKAGTPVQLTLTNAGTLDHTFAIPGLVKELKLLPGQSTTLNFTPSVSRDYKFLCTVPGHEALGMAGIMNAIP